MKISLKLPDSELNCKIRAALIALGTYLLLFGLLSAAITPQHYDIRVGEPADTTIYASEDVVDTVTTQQLRAAAAAQVDVSYKSVDESVTSQVSADLTALFDQLLALAQSGGEVPESMSMRPTSEQLEALLAAPRGELEALFERATEYTRDALLSTLPEGQEEAMISRLGRDLLSEGYDEELVEIAQEAVRACIRPNMLIDEETTELNRERAREEVEDVVCVAGEVIVRQGAIVTPAQYAMLEALGKVDSDPTNMILGSALLMLVLIASVAMYMYRYERDIWRRPRTLLLLGIIYVTVVALALFFRIFNAFFVPTATGLGLLLITLLVRPRLALFSTALLAIPVSLIAGASDNGLFNAVTFSVLLMSFVGGPVAVTVLRHRQQRTAALLAGLLLGVSNFLCMVAVGMINGTASGDNMLLDALCAAGSGLCAAILCIGVQPLLEWLFNLTTSAKLLELSNPNQPLLRRMLLEAPGSYHHSIIVANLAETAASAIGANGLLARVGAYYHDVGKLKRPQYFKENQMTGDNPHDRTDPRVSAAILTAHTRDGYQMGLKARLPEPILDIIRQHHGDSPMVFFYDKAVKLYGDKVDISAFRYEGPRPRSREAAIVMLADTIEAAARALPNPDPEKVDALIRKLVRAKMTDGQLDESELTFADLDRICRAFQSVLSGVFHERIEYPDVDIPPRVEAEAEPALEEPTIAPEAETGDVEDAD